MNGTWTIFRREIGQYFTSPISYIIAGTLLILTGLYFNGDVAFSLTVKPINPSLIPDFMATAMLFFGPLLTMRMLAEEQREGTMELLLTAPVNDNAIVIGKFLSAWLYYSILLAITFSYQIIVARISRPDMAHTICAYIGIWLYGGAALAIGLMFSALTENQIVAAFLGIATLTFLYLGNVAGQIVTNLDLARAIREITLTAHYADSFAYGIVKGEDVAYFGGIIVIMLFIAVRVVESHRWR
jgi:ABC-2 type transport system permease protein